MQTTGLKRKTIDKFYTSPSIVNECIKLINEKISIQQHDLCIEPSAGNGSFIEGIKSLSKNYEFYDLEPENNEIIKQDYLEYDCSTLQKKRNTKIHTIGNPPFGRQSSLAIKFIKKASEYSDSISFILPKSFKKDSLKKHFALKYHLIYEYDLPKDSFLVDNKKHDVPCVFQIWEKKDYDREVIKKLEPLHFKFVKKTENPDISFRRVGVYAGKIDTNIDDKSEQSHYFIKFNNKSNKIKNIEIFKNVKFEFNNSVGPKSISKQELLLHVNNHLH